MKTNENDDNPGRKAKIDTGVDSPPESGQESPSRLNSPTRLPASIVKERESLKGTETMLFGDPEAGIPPDPRTLDFTNETWLWFLDSLIARHQRIIASLKSLRAR